ncbi:MAG: polysaccharide deacetylase family protein [Acidobacteria bacterium]|nr:polysaccharide deacetylase family protein [Acidobacteriota bacterium]
MTRKYLILHADDFGMCHASNVGTSRALNEGLATSASVMVPCPWAAEVARMKRENPRWDLGVHLTLTAEWGSYKWGPISSRDAVPSLVDQQGYFWPTRKELYDRATLEDVERECRAQIGAALRLGLEPSHLDSHVGALQYREEYHQIFLNLAVEYGLHLRMASDKLQGQYGVGHRRSQARALGVTVPDDFIYLRASDAESPESRLAALRTAIRALKPGITEMYFHPAADSEELRALASRPWEWQVRVFDLEFLTSDETWRLLEDCGVQRLSYRDLGRVQPRVKEPL